MPLPLEQFLSAVLLRIFPIQNLEPLLLQCGKVFVCAKSGIGGTDSEAYRLVALPEYQYSNLFHPLSLQTENTPSQERSVMLDLPLKLWKDEQGQDIAEYAVMLAVILVLVVGTIRLVGSNANNAFSSVASTIQ